MNRIAINTSHSEDRILTAVLLGGGGAPYRLAVLLPGTITITNGKMLPTNGTRVSSQSQPDQPISCRRWTLN
ncbi:hypothetical protein D3C85_1923630 [compost metagenome]